MYTFIFYFLLFCGVSEESFGGFLFSVWERWGLLLGSLAFGGGGGMEGVASYLRWMDFEVRSWAYKSHCSCARWEGSIEAGFIYMRVSP